MSCWSSVSNLRPSLWIFSISNLVVWAICSTRYAPVSACNLRKANLLRKLLRSRVIEIKSRLFQSWGLAPFFSYEKLNCLIPVATSMEWTRSWQSLMVVLNRRACNSMVTAGITIGPYGWGDMELKYWNSFNTTWVSAPNRRARILPVLMLNVKAIEKAEYALFCWITNSATVV